MNRRAWTSRRNHQTGALFAVQFALIGLLTFGCAGYHIGPVTKRNFNSIAVPMFRNTTLNPQIEAQISNAVIQRLQQDGSLRIEPESKADVVLKGTITKYYREPLRSLRTDTGVPREYEITITVRVEATDRRTGETALKSTEVEGKTDVFIGEDQQSAEEQALPLIADDIGKRVAGLLVESWQ
jgi:hypothetical protein